jgi:vacuolar-type H+-ATPase subunit I/STV1
MLMFKEVIDAFEDAVDCAYNASTYSRLVGLGMYG